MDQQQDQMSDEIIDERSGEGDGRVTAVLGSREDQFMIGVISTDKIRSLDYSENDDDNEDGNVIMVPSVMEDVDESRNTKMEIGLSAIKEGAGNLLHSFK